MRIVKPKQKRPWRSKESIMKRLERQKQKYHSDKLNSIGKGPLCKCGCGQYANKGYRYIYHHSRSKKLSNLKVFATTNNVDVLSTPTRSRFMDFHLPEYNYEQFCEIARKLLETRLGHSNEIADEIATAVWNEMNSKDIRDVLAIAKLVHNIEDVSWLVQVHKKYGMTSSEVDNSGNLYQT